MHSQLHLQKFRKFKYNLDLRNRFVYTSSFLSQLTTFHQISHEPKKDKVFTVNPFKLIEQDLNTLFKDIRSELATEKDELKEIASYYFDGKGKAFRPMIVVLIARAINIHINRSPQLTQPQKVVAMATEMLHTASLVHDDVIDIADTRRGKPSINVLWGQKKSILAGDFILSRASQMLARLKNDEVICLLSQVRLT